jgi:transposase
MSGKRVQVELTEEEERTLRELRQGNNVPQRVKDRAEAVRLNAQGWYVEKIAAYLAWSLKAVREAIKRWKEKGLGGLWDQARVGRPPILSAEDMACIKKWLREEERTYNAQQIVERLRKERKVEISATRLRRILKEEGIRWKRTRSSHKKKQDPELKAIKQQQLEELERMAQNGEVDLYYMDESGCSPWSEPSYSYFFEGEQKRQEQTAKQGKRVNILGFFQPFVTFFYALVVGRVDSQVFIKVMDEQARQAAKVLEIAAKIRVIVIDNCSIHTSKVVRACWQRWRSQGLFLFFLPRYCSEMNPIELEWEHLKRDEIAGRMFENEKSLAAAIEQGLDERAQKLGHTTERFCA